MLQTFSLDPSMIATLGGAFYPTGYSMVMFPDRESAVEVGERMLADAKVDEAMLVPPAAILTQIARTVSDADEPLPSVGTEGATVRAYIKLAREGHHGLLVKTPDEDAAERMMEVVRTRRYSMAQRYRTLVVEDL